MGEVMRKLTKREERAFTRHAFQQDFIEEGSGRKVYYFRNVFVVKIAKNRNGRRQNKLEAQRYLKYGGEKLAKIIAYSKNVIIMERVNNDIEALQQVAPEKSLALGKWLDEICEIESEDHYESQGLRSNGDLVAYDYGDSKQTYPKRLLREINVREEIATEGADILCQD